MLASLLLALAFAPLCQAHFVLTGSTPLDLGPYRKQVNETHSGYCATEQIWARKIRERAGSLASCPTEGSCDTPSVRNSAPTSTVMLRVAVIVVGNEIVTERDIEQQMQTLAADFNPYGIVFQLVHTAFFPGNCISPYGSSDAWYNEVQALKQKYAYSPSTTMNIIVTCQKSGSQGELLGFGAFPWDPEALTYAGGVWVNSAYFGLGQKTLDHEVGHNVGLWHTFHGVSETDGCSDPCTENVHPYDAPAADVVGDFCSDTPATPVNYNCNNPTGRDCNKVAWGTTDYSNLMAYAADTCIDHFTDQQLLRAHCWVCSSLKQYVVNVTAACS